MRLVHTLRVTLSGRDDRADSIDMLDALHPQTLLAYGMNGRDLPLQHGAPRIRQNPAHGRFWLQVFELDHVNVLMYLLRLSAKSK